jgi:hypothetical protein
MNRCYAFSRRRFIRCPPRHLAVEDLLTQLLPIHRRYVESSGAEGILAKTLLYASSRLSVHPVLNLQSWRVSVLIQTKRRIDRQCPHSDRQIIRCYCIRCSSSAIHPAHLETGSSVHPTVSTSFGLLHSVPTTSTLCTDGTVGSSNGVIYFSFLSCF